MNAIDSTTLASIYPVIKVDEAIERLVGVTGNLQSASSTVALVTLFHAILIFFSVLAFVLSAKSGWGSGAFLLTLMSCLLALDAFFLVVVIKFLFSFDKLDRLGEYPYQEISDHLEWVYTRRRMEESVWAMPSPSENKMPDTEAEEQRHLSLAKKSIRSDGESMSKIRIAMRQFAVNQVMNLFLEKESSASYFSLNFIFSFGMWFILMWAIIVT